MNYLIDTNILVIYVRDTDLTRRLEEDLRLLTGDNNLVISVVSIGEIKSIAKQNKWGEKRVRRLIEILSQFLIADINVESTFSFVAGTALPCGKRKLRAKPAFTET